MTSRLQFFVPILLAASACAAAGAGSDGTGNAGATVQPNAEATPTPVEAPNPETVSARPDQLQIEGQLTQGGWVRAVAPANVTAVELNGQPVALDDEGRFFAAFDRDAEARAELGLTLADGTTRTQTLDISPRKWNIEHVNVARRSGGTSEAWWAKREPEWNAIVAARAQETGATGWQQDFIWPVKGRISGRFGSQRIYRGEPGSYHSGLDIAPGAGVPFVAPADGTVVLAVTGFSMEGNLIILDHGNGLNSAFLHAQTIAVSQGDKVRQGQLLGRVGATGRATGPHLHWSLKWRDNRLDPLLFLPDAD